MVADVGGPDGELDGVAALAAGAIDADVPCLLAPGAGGEEHAASVKHNALPSSKDFNIVSDLVWRTSPARRMRTRYCCAALEANAD